MAKTIYQKRLKLHKLAHNIITTKDELEKKRLRIQLKRQNTILNNTIKMMVLELIFISLQKKKKKI